MNYKSPVTYCCALPPSLLALQSLLPWPSLNTLLCVHRILSAWKALLHPSPHVLGELLRLNSNDFPDGYSPKKSLPLHIPTAFAHH